MGRQPERPPARRQGCANSRRRVGLDLELLLVAEAEEEVVADMARGTRTGTKIRRMLENADKTKNQGRKKRTERRKKIKKSRTFKARATSLVVGSWLI